MKTGIQMLKFGLFAGSALFAMAGTAHAGQAADTTATTAAPISGEIIVTAQRRDQSLQDVPMTLQALSADSLSKLNVTTFNDLIKYTPNVTFGNNGPGQGAIFMRGLSAGFAGEQSAGTIGGFPLGIMPDSDYRQTEISLSPGDVVVVYSDGVPDSRSPSEELYDYRDNRRLINRVSESSGSPEAVGRAILQEIREYSAGHSQTDDITLICFGPLAK